MLSVLFVCTLHYAAQPAYPLSRTDKALELQYAEGLIELGLPVYADKVLATLGTSPETKVLKIKSFLLTGQFDEAKQIIGNEPDQQSLDVWAMKLTLADSYFAFGRYGEAKGVYESFFTTYKEKPPDEILKFFFESSYRYAQMLLLLNDRERAIEAYQRAIDSGPPKHIERQIMAEMGELKLTMAAALDESKHADTLEEVEKLADELLWKQDVWFGKGIVLKAHIKLQEGDSEGAIKLVEDYKAQLINIDRQLKEQGLTQLSPMAQVRYLVGSMALSDAKRMLEEGGDRAEIEALLMGREISVLGKRPKKIVGALQHFLNVFVLYPETPWAPDAGLRFEETKKILEEEFERTINFKVTDEQWSKVADNQLRQAKARMNQQQYADAVAQYLVVVNRFPEALSIVGGLSDLAVCYLELEDDLRVDTVIHYLAERFNKHGKLTKNAGNAVLNIAGIYKERGREDRHDAIHEVYFEHFTTHPLAARLLYTTGNQRLSDGDVQGALRYLEKVVIDHAESPISYVAMSRIAAAYNESGEKEKEVKALTAYTDRLLEDKRLDHQLITGFYRLASAYRQLGGKYYVSAINRYNEIIKRLGGNPEENTTGAQQAGKNQEILEAAIFYKAYCYGKLPPPKNKPGDFYKEEALKMYMNLAKTYPDSKRTPQALSQAGTLLTVLEKPGEAKKIFQSLKDRYPDSPEAQNVDFLLAMSLMDIGLRNDAIEVLKRMFTGDSTYSFGQILTAGNELFKAGEYEIAMEAYDRILATALERAHIEAALAGRGRALVALERYAEGAQDLKKLFEQFPKTSFTVDAAYDLSRAHARLAAEEVDADERFDIFNKSIVAMQKVLAYEPQRRGQAKVEVARIQERKAEAERKNGSTVKADRYRNEAIATYQTVILFEDAQDVSVRPHLEDAYHACIRLFLEVEQWQDAYDDANEYLKVFQHPKFEADVRNWRSKAAAKLRSLDSSDPSAPDGEDVISPAQADRIAS